MEHKTVMELTSLASLEWAPFIDRIWDANQQIWFASDMNLPEPIECDGGIVFNYNMHSVILSEDSHCQCSCNGYASACIPCPVMVGVCQKHYGAWKKLKYLHPQWHLGNHPWHPHRASQPRNDVESEEQNQTDHDYSGSGCNDDANNAVYNAAYSTTRVPSKKWFGSELRQHIERIITFVKNEDDFRHVVATLTVVQHKLENVAPGAAREPRKVNVPVTSGQKVGPKDATKNSSKRHRSEANPASERESEAPKKKRSVSKKSRIGEQCDAVIRQTIRNNGGLRNGLVIEVEPDPAAKKKAEKWFMTVVDGRLKDGIVTSNAMLQSCR
jgi:hypothetical protein